MEGVCSGMCFYAEGSVIAQPLCDEGWGEGGVVVDGACGDCGGLFEKGSEPGVAGAWETP